MSQPRLDPRDDGRLYLAGKLSLETVPGLLAQCQSFAGEGKLIIDLEGVERADSAGVALLVKWQRDARQQQRTISFQNIPPQMLAIARVSGVDELLSLS